MDEENLVEGETLETQGESVTPTITEEELGALKKNAELAENYKVRAEKAEAERKALEKKLNEAPKQTKAALDVEDYIDISASLEGLDQREKERLAYEHKMTGKSLKDLRASEDFQLWQSAYKQKLEKELAVKPSSTQTESEKPKSLTEKLRGATLADKEKILEEMGLYKQPRPRSDRVEIRGRNI